jgi:hypothetical protein
MAIVCGAIIMQVVAATPAHSQSIICCSENIGVGGSWVGSSRIADCQQYFNSAPPAVLRRMCAQRAALSCINTARCSELPSGEVDPPQSDASGPNPPDVDREGLEQGFYGAPPPTPPAAAPPPAMPRRLVYIAAWGGQGDKNSKTFTAWLDGTACPLPLDKDNRLADSAAAKHVVRGKVTRRDGRVRIEAEAQERPGGVRIGPFAGEALGDDAAAIAKATRAVAKKMKLVCAR